MPPQKLKEEVERMVTQVKELVTTIESMYQFEGAKLTSTYIPRSESKYNYHK